MSDDLDEKLRDLKQKLNKIFVSRGDNSAAVRKIATECLQPRTELVSDHKQIGNPDLKMSNTDLGLNMVAIVYLYAIGEASPRPFGFGKLTSELDEIGSAFKTLANRLKSMSPETMVWINSSWRDEYGTPAMEKERLLRVQGNAGPDVFPETKGDIPPLVTRLEALSDLMDLLSKQAQESNGEAIGAQSIFFRELPDHQLFCGCGQVLLDRGYDLKHLRPIAEAIYYWAHGSTPSDSWGIRAEKQARITLTAMRAEE